MNGAGEIPRPLFLSSSLISFFVFPPSVRPSGVALSAASVSLDPFIDPMAAAADAVGRSLTPFARLFCSSRCLTCPLLFLFWKRNHDGSEVNGTQLKVEDSSAELWYGEKHVRIAKLYGGLGNV